MLQKWEYLFVLCEDTKEAWRPRYVNGQELRDWKRGSSQHEFSNQMGEQGWELVSSDLVLTSNYGQVGLNAIRMIFKRPK